MKQLSLFMLLAVVLAACTEDDNKLKSPDSIEGLKPVYSQNENPQLIVAQAPEAITKGSKIYIKGNFVYIVENGLGVHVIENTNPSNPTDIRFIKIPGVSDVAVRNQTMYANNFADIVAINISNLQTVSESSRLNGVFQLDENILNLPSNYSGYFECVDESKGVVVAWETTILNKPKCYR